MEVVAEVVVNIMVEFMVEVAGEVVVMEFVVVDIVVVEVIVVEVVVELSHSVYLALLSGSVVYLLQSYTSSCLISLVARCCSAL